MENAEAVIQDPRLWNSVIALAAVTILTMLIKGLLVFLIKKLQKLAARTSSDWDDIVLHALAGTRTWVIFVWLAGLALPMLKFHESVNKAGHHVAVIVSALQVAIWGLRAVSQWRDNFILKQSGSDTSSVAAIGLLGTFLQCLMVTLVILLALSNLGIDVGALIAGLGIGGIAIALAAQNVLGDLLASLSIVLDKPFVVGDFIVVGDKSGTVAHIGVKTTRLTSLSGEQLVFSNKNLIEGQIQNFKRMQERRVILKIGVTYSTPREKLEKIPGWLRAFVEEDKALRFDRSHFMGFGGSSLDFELVFYVMNPEYNYYMDHQQALLLKIHDCFSANKVDFAFPSQSLYIESQKVPGAFCGTQSVPQTEPGTV